MRVRLSSEAIERSVNAREDRDTLRRRATADRHARRRLHALPAGRVREPRALSTRRARRSRRASRRAIRCDRRPPPGTRRCGRAASRSSATSRPTRAFAQALCARADVVLEGFRPGVAARLGIGPDDVPDNTVVLLDHGLRRRHDSSPREPGHDVNYLGWAGVLEDTRTGLPPIQIADLAAGALGAVTQILAALLERARTGTGRARRRLDDPPLARPRRASPRRRARASTADRRPRVLPDLRDRRRAPPHRRRARAEVLPASLRARRPPGPRRPAVRRRIRTRSRPSSAASSRRATLEDWLDHFGDEDVCVGPVWTRDEAAAAFGSGDAPVEVPLGAHTEAWRQRARPERS